MNATRQAATDFANAKSPVFNEFKFFTTGEQIAPYEFVDTKQNNSITRTKCELHLCYAQTSLFQQKTSLARSANFTRGALRGAPGEGEGRLERVVERDRSFSFSSSSLTSA